MTNKPGFKARQSTAYANLGRMIGVMQTVEQMLRFTMIYIFQEAPPLNMEKLLSQQQRTAKRTVGQFMVELKKRVAIHPGFETVLDEFLALRNDVIHDHSRISGWDFKTDEGLQTVTNTLGRLLDRATTILKILTALMIDWSNQVGFNTDTDIGKDEPFFIEVQESYIPMLQHMFAAHSADEEGKQ